MILNAAQPTFGAGTLGAFVTKLSPSGGLVYSTYLGGAIEDRGVGIAVDGLGAAYVNGSTKGSFPMLNAAQPDLWRRGVRRVLLTKSSLQQAPSRIQRIWAGAHGITAGAFAVDSLGAAYVTGSTPEIFPL